MKIIISYECDFESNETEQTFRADCWDTMLKLIPNEDKVQNEWMPVTCTRVKTSIEFKD